MKKVVFSFLATLLWLAETVTAQRINVATYNMRNDNNKEDSLRGDGWGQRFPVIASLIRFHDFDIFGTQECLYHQLVNVKDSLPGYDFIGIGRDDGKRAGEHAAIFYKTGRFQLLGHGDFWLSAVTDRPNKGWDAVLPRICSWGQFKDKKTGFVFYFFNLHMDHVGVVARAESAKLVLAKVKEIAGNKPALLTGDFNVDQHSESYGVIHNSGVMKDAYEVTAVRYALNGTFNSFKSDSKTDSRIDHIFLTKQFKVSRYGILTDTYRSKRPEEVAADAANFPKEVKLSKYIAREPSDHFPVMAVLEYGK
ncbi:endonuclease/exonuclease/phosphatase family protein [Chitinophaga oryzae]|uniref:Endonuclease/exonuclease/phosphatase family protein n=1 Tax=Chitinophaga oryzae TaxID=2725414 RepID=A0AAE7DAY1_9BACT|nr:endonuclease/exonuclease/phosphatase family protein [Chitinophaga oryzae]QJB34789.1 endonuclease/exonuclease/phosphatase family protein [Chitinophaga oryzae]QJB41303.1 endonuclease/exonuclease/phosphatase family protein [Chitinophaga oryzae]